MKIFVNVPVIIYLSIKKNFFNLINTIKKGHKNGLKNAKKEQQNFTDEYHKAFSGVTRWQTL